MEAMLYIVSIGFGAAGIYGLVCTFTAGYLEGTITCLFLTLFLFALAVGCFWLGWYLDHNKVNNPSRQTAERQEIERERGEAIRNSSSNAPWEKKYFTAPCPHCGHYKVRYATWDDKRASVAFWGAASDKLGKAYICEHCNQTWN